MPRLYFDQAATTPLDPRVAAAIRTAAQEFVGNPSSLHTDGRAARSAVEHARAQVAALINAAPEEIVFTASGTETDNFALFGAVAELAPSGVRLVTSAIEHPAVHETCRHLGRQGATVDSLPVDSEGVVQPEFLADALATPAQLVSAMEANNIVGAIEPIQELSTIARERSALFHTDAVQAAGHIPIDVRTTPIDLLSLSAHKLNGPKGIGALYVRSGVAMHPVVHGGGQERGLRSATENVAGIVGFGMAAEIAKAEMAHDAARLVTLRDHLIDGVLARIPGAYLLGPRYRRLPGHVCLAFAGHEGEAIKLLLALDEAGVAVSTGSACSASHRSQPSHVLRAMGFDPFRARGALRATLGRFNTAAEVDQFLQLLPPLVSSLGSITTLRTSPSNER